jgi:hypothetical protein
VDLLIDGLRLQREQVELQRKNTVESLFHPELGRHSLTEQGTDAPRKDNERKPATDRDNQRPAQHTPHAIERVGVGITAVGAADNEVAGVV